MRGIRKPLAVLAGLIAASALFAFAAEIAGTENSDYASIMRAFAARSYGLAQDRIEHFLKSYPASGHSERLRVLLGRCFYYQRKTEKALYEFDAIAEMPGESAFRDEALCWVGDIFYGQEKYENALSSYQAVIDNYSASRFLPYSRYSKAWSYYRLGYADKAKENFSELARLFPMDKLAVLAQFEIGKLSYETARYDDALKELKAYLEKYPVSEHVGDALFLCGESAYLLGRYDDAAGYYQSALGLSKEAPWRDIANFRIAESSFRKGDFGKARELFGRFYAESGDERLKGYSLLGEALSLKALGDNGGALRKFSDFSELFPRDDAAICAYREAVDILFRDGRYKEAESVALKGLSTLRDKESKIELRYDLGWIYKEEGRTDEAIGEFLSIGESPEDADLRQRASLRVGELYLKGGRYDEAAEAFDLFLTKYVDSPYVDYAQYQLGWTLMAEGRVEQAMLAFQSMLVNFPDSRLTGMALYNLGLAYFKRGQFHLAAAEFEKSIKAMPLNDAEFSEKARFCLANSFYLLGRYEEALELFKKTESSPNGEMAMMSGYKAALCYYNMAKDEEALKRLNVLLKKYPEAGLAADIKYWLGERCYAKGDKRGALGNFDEVVSRWPGSPLAGDAHRKMGNLLAEKGDFDSAIGHFKEALADEKVELKAQVQYQIGECFERKNQPEIAVEEYLKVATLYPEGTFWSIRAKLKSAMIFEGLKKAAEARRLYEELAGLDVEESKFAKERLSALQHN